MTRLIREPLLQLVPPGVMLFAANAPLRGCPTEVSSGDVVLSPVPIERLAALLATGVVDLEVTSRESIRAA